MVDFAETYQKDMVDQSIADNLRKLGLTPNIPTTQDAPAPQAPTPEVPKPTDPNEADALSNKVLDAEKEVMDAVGGFFKELPMAVVGGLGDAANNLISGARDLGKLAHINDLGSLQITNAEGDLDLKFLSQEELETAGGLKDVFPTVDPQENAGAGMVRAITTFAAGFIPAAKGVKALGAGAMVAGAVGGAIADAVVMDPHQQRLATMLNEVPLLGAVVPDYLADNNPENESVWEGRMKNAIDGIIPGVAIDGTLRMLKAYKVQKLAQKAAKAEDVSPEQAVKDLGDAMDAKADAADELVQPMAPTGNKAIDDALGMKMSTDTPGVTDDALLTAKEGDTFINMSRIKTSEDVKKIMKDVADESTKTLDAAGKTHKGIAKESEKAFTEIKDLLGREPTRPFTSAEAVAARKIWTASGENIAAMLPDARKSKEGMFAFRQALARHKDIESVVLHGRKATAQSLNSWAIPAGSSEFRGKQISALLEGMTGNIDDMAKKLTDVLDESGVDAMAKAAAKVTDSKWSDSIYQVWINGLLSGPATHAANFISNAGTTTMGIGEKYISAGYETMFTRNGNTFVEANAKAAGFTSGLMDGFNLMVGNMDDTRFLKGTKIEHQAAGLTAQAWGKSPDSAIGKGIDYLGKIINLPGKALQRGDVFFKGINYRMVLNEKSTKQAIEEGLTGSKLTARVKELVANPTEALDNVSLEYANYQTFTNEAGTLTKDIMKVFSHTGGRYIMPFVKTPANVLKYGLERTPLALASGKIRGELMKGGAEGAAVAAKLTAGGLVMSAAAALTLNEALTGAGPVNFKERHLLEQTGWQPYSFKAGDTYISYARLEPIGSLLGYAADMAEIGGMIGEEEGETLAVAGAAAFFRSMGQKTFVSGAMKAIEVAGSGDPKKISKYFQAMGASFTPYSGLGKTVNKYFDEVKRDTTPDSEMGFLRSMVEKSKANVPGWGSDAPALRDIWGREMHSNHGVAPMIENVSPINISQNRNDAVSEMIADNKIVVDRPSRNMNGVKLTNKEYSAYCEIAGKKAKTQLDKMYKRGQFKTKTGGADGGKALMVKAVLRQARQFAKGKLVKKFPEVKDRVIQNKKDAKDALKGE